MNISDEQLSAFLDAELPATEMEVIRQQLSVDEHLANRLAELAVVDEYIASHYARIDDKPLPEATTRLLSTREEASEGAQVITFPLWKRMHRSLQQHAAIAASVALVIGFGTAQLLPDNSNSANNWNAVAQVLDNTRSGHEQTLGDGSRVKPRLSFINQEGNYCRQFQVTNNKHNTENIACRIDNTWQLTMAIYSQGSTQSDDYQTASGGSVMDNALDEMMHSEAFDVAAEVDAIKNHWNRNQ